MLGNFNEVFSLKTLLLYIQTAFVACVNVLKIFVNLGVIGMDGSQVLVGNVGLVYIVILNRYNMHPYQK